MTREKEKEKNSGGHTMNKKEKREFVIALCDEIKEYILEKLDAMPEYWDGHELREYLKDTTVANAAWIKMPPVRLREYRNELKVNGKI